jgi:hypothetical protein
MRFAPAVLVAMLTAACARDTTGPVAPEAIAELAVLTAAASTTDFESFTVGAIHGQFDWQSIGGVGSSSAASRCATYDHVIAETGIPPAFGSRVLRISNAVTSGCYADHTFSQRSTDIAGQAGSVSRSRDGTVEYAIAGAVRRARFDASWTFVSAVPDAQQPGLEVVVSPARGDDHRMSWVQMRDLADGIEVRFAQRADAANPGAIQVMTIASVLDRSMAHTIRLVIDFRDGPANDVARVFVDGVLRHTGASWETYYALDANGSLNFGGNPPAVNRLMFRTGSDTHRGIPGDPAPATSGRGFFFDDVSVDAYAVPTGKDDCKNDGWRSLRSDSGTQFKNQGDCVSSVASSK